MDLQLSPHVEIRKLRDELAGLRDKMRMLEARRPPASVHPQQVRWAMTVQDGETSWPATDANVFPIVFLDAEFTATQGQQTIDVAARQAAPPVKAFSAMGNWIQPGLPIPAFHLKGLGDDTAGVWWLMDPPKWYIVKLNGTLSPNGSALANIWLYDSTDTLIDSGCEITVWDSGQAAETVASGSWGAADWIHDIQEGGDPVTSGRWVMRGSKGGLTLGKPDADISAGSSGTVSVWTGAAGAETDSGDNIAGCHNHSNQTAAQDVFVLVGEAHGEKYIIRLQDSGGGSDNFYRTAIGVIGASNLAATNLATNPGNITPTAATNTEGTVPLSSSANNAIFWPDLNGSSQIVFSRNLLADKTFYNATPFAMVSGDRVWVQEFPVQDGAGDARDVDTGLGKRWIVRGFQRTKPYALLTSSGWNGTDFKLDWTITSQKGGLVSLVNSNKHVQFDIPVYQYPFKVTISGFLNWDLGTNPLSIHFQGVLNGFRTDQWMVHFQPTTASTTVTTGNPSATTTSGPTPDVTGAASAGTAHTHSLSAHTHAAPNHTHTWNKSDLPIGPKDYDLFSGYGHPWHFDMVGYKPDVTQNDVTWLSITPLGGCSVSGLVSGGGSNVQMLIEPMFDG